MLADGCRGSIAKLFPLLLHLAPQSLRAPPLRPPRARARRTAASAARGGKGGAASEHARPQKSAYRFRSACVSCARLFVLVLVLVLARLIKLIAPCSANRPDLTRAAAGQTTARRTCAARLRSAAATSSSASSSPFIGCSFGRRSEKERKREAKTNERVLCTKSIALVAARIQITAASAAASGCWPFCSAAAGEQDSSLISEMSFIFSGAGRPRRVFRRLQTEINDMPSAAAAAAAAFCAAKRRKFGAFPSFRLRSNSKNNTRLTN